MVDSGYATKDADFIMVETGDEGKEVVMRHASADAASTTVTVLSRTRWGDMVLLSGLTVW